MSEQPARPDPDQLLSRVKDDELRASRGKLKVFFGFAPGVGKTYRMLQVARDLVSDQKLDLVVGIVETHRRRETAALVLGLELLPQRKVEYRGHVIEEFDLDAAIARRPAAILVDELAHTNAPGSRHPKRWRDVEELLEAGIDVFTTMNVQHVESLNDVVEQITHVQVRETVPDSVLDKADAVELVDIAPEELLERLREGKVYLAEQAKLAVEHFFHRGNLLALRELALRRTAQYVDEDVLEYRAAHGISTNVPAGERILVCVGPAPSSGRLIRAAARLAAGLRCPWVAASVDSPMQNLSDADRERLDGHLRLAETLSASVARLSGSSVADALLNYARRHNVSRLLIGKPTHSRLRDRLRGSLLDDVVRGSGDIDVHVISGDASGELPGSRVSPSPSPLRLSQYLLSSLLVSVTLGLAAILRATLHLPDLEMLFLITVMINAVWLGRGPALYAAVLGVAAYDFFFVPPYMTFNVADRRYFLTFLMMFVIGYVISELTNRIKRQETDAISREERTAVLYALTKELSSVGSAQSIAEVGARQAADVFLAEVVVMQAATDGTLVKIGAYPADSTLDSKESGVAKWALERLELAGYGTETLPGAASICAPLRVGGSALGILRMQLHEPRPLSVEQRSFLDVFCRLLGAALERVRLAEEARVAAIRVKAEEMRSSLLSAVSHDLRTPLASITGAATALRDDSNLSQVTRVELTESICDEAERLECLVSNLLDMTRLESGNLSLKRDWVPLDELIGGAWSRLEPALIEHPVHIDISPQLPLVFVDPVSFGQIFVNLFENASKYTPRGSKIEIRATRISHEFVEVVVQDQGPGVAEGLEERLFEKFYRGTHQGVSGAGLGLAICRGIAEAHGGTIRARRVPDGGLALHVMVPIGGPPPAIVESEAEPSEKS